MTLINEKSRVPKVTERELERLATAFDRPGVVAASLIGSQARGTPGPLSDVDLAVWHDRDLDSGARRRLRLDLLGAGVDVLGTDEVDLVMLNGAPPLLQHRAMRDGKRFLDRKPADRVQLEARALVEYLDTAPLRDLLSKQLRSSIEEGRFGRPSVG